MKRSVKTATTMLCAIASAAHAAEPLPRIFYAPAERSDVTGFQATSTTPESPLPQAAQSEASATETTPVLRLNGIATAASGATYAWFDGQRFADGSRLGPWQLRIRDRVVTLRDQNGHSRTLRVGETISATVR